jgi:hypothetical protein
LLSPVLQIIHRVIATFLIKQAGVKRKDADTGAVTLIQRFGSAANLNIHLHCLVLDGIYVISEGEAVFQEAHAPTPGELQALLVKIITRLLRLLTRQGHLVEEQGMTYMADIGSDNPLTPLQAASCTYRIALGPRAGQKVLSLQSISRRGEPVALSTVTTPTLCANLHGFSLHAAVRIRGQRTEDRSSESRENEAGGSASTEECLPRRHHAYRHVAAGIHAAPGRSGAASALTSDPLPWRACAH